MGFQLIAMAVLAVFYGCYVVKMICQKKKGIQTDQIGKGKAGFVKLIEVTMKISAYLVLGAGIISIVLDASDSPSLIRIIGVVVSAAGTAIFITAVLTMRDSWRAGVSPTDKTELVTSGIYQFSRNPAFVHRHIADVFQLGFVRSVRICHSHVSFTNRLCGGSVFACHIRG